jgi:hypothetical protein
MNTGLDISDNLSVVLYIVIPMLSSYADHPLTHDKLIADYNVKENEQ